MEKYKIIEEKFTKIHESDKVFEVIFRFIDDSENKIDFCISSLTPLIIIQNDTLKNKFIDAAKRGVKLSFVTEITKDNLGFIKEIMSFSHIRHLDNIKGNFGISDEREYITIANFQKLDKISLIFSNVHEIVEQQKFIFDSFWERAVPAERKIKELEDGLLEPITYIFSDYRDALKKETEMIKKATKEIQIIYSTANAFHLQEKCGTLQLLMDMAEQNRELVINILTPLDESIRQSIRYCRLNNVTHHNISFHNIASSIDIKIKSLVVDKNESLIMELKHMKEEKETASIGFSIYSNSDSIALSYRSIFEVISNQSILFHDLKEDDNLKSEFINIAAHELRTPIMPILNVIEILEDKLIEKKVEFKREMDIIKRNALRLHNLAESILQVSRIEGGRFNLHMQNNVNINVLISQVIEDIKKKYIYTDKSKKISVLFLPFGNENISENMGFQNKFFDQLINSLKCDYQKISQVVFNLLDNAMKFTIENNIVISVLQYELGQDKNIDETIENINVGNETRKYMVVTVKNIGLGVDPEIKDHLFEKFFTKSIHGTGLGLYLSKIIVEAHGGRIWLEEYNDDNDTENSQDDIYHIGKKKINTIFRFSLPFLNERNMI